MNVRKRFRHAVGDPFVDPEERFILFASIRKEGCGKFDIYISYRQPDGSWGEAVNPGDRINTAHFERFPSVSRDGKILFFVRNTESDMPGNDAFYWVSTDVLEGSG